MTYNQYCAFASFNEQLVTKGRFLLAQYLEPVIGAYILIFTFKSTKAYHTYTVVQKLRTPVIFSKDFNKYWSIFTIFGTQNKQWVCDVHMCNLLVLMKQRPSLGLFYSKRWYNLLRFRIAPARVVFSHAWRRKSSRNIRRTDKRWTLVFLAICRDVRCI